MDSGWKLDVPFVQAHVALEGYFVLEAGHDDVAVLGDRLGLDRDYRAGDETELVRGVALHSEEEVRGAWEPVGHRPRDPGRHALVGGDGACHGEREIVLEEPDEAGAPGAELDPALGWVA